MNPWNTQITDANRKSFIEMDEMRAIPDFETAQFLKKIKTSPNPKKYYLAMEFNKINNPEFQNERYYSLSTIKEYNRTLLYSTQINNITMEMPSTPILFNWNKIPKVFSCD